MGQALRKSDLEGADVSGSAIVTSDRIADPIADPLRTHEKWLAASDLAELAGIADRVARKAITSRRWRGADLLVQEVQIGRGGAGGKALQVHVDSLPSDLREAWYLERGIVLHEKPDTETGKTVLVPEQAVLDHLAAFYGVARQVIQEADATMSPPVEETLEDDARLRSRVQLAPEGFTTAGSLGSYTFWALSSSPLVKDVAILETATPGEVRIVVLSTEADGASTAELLTQVDATTQPRRPLTDHVMVEGATVQAYSIEAELTLYEGPDAEVVRIAAEAALETYIDEHHRLGHDITLSAIYAALHQPGVQNVAITQPAADIVVAPDAVAFCASDALAVLVGGRDV